MIVDIGGGQCRDIDTDAQLLGLIAEKISLEVMDMVFEWYKISEKMCSDCRAAMDHDADMIAEENSLLRGALDEIESLAQQAQEDVENAKRLDRRALVKMFRDIDREARNAL